uniref:Uncharacterized protein n=1 Tax=Lates calcarifer TaxID=8187 RepID=A0A4W6DN05_LATCA
TVTICTNGIRCIMHYGCQNNVITSTDMELMLNHCAALTAGRRTEGGFHC